MEVDYAAASFTILLSRLCIWSCQNCQWDAA